jgi:hypothetical protein
MPEIVIIDTVKEKTYYRYNGILCAVIITGDMRNDINPSNTEPLSVFEQNLIVERFHSSNNKLSEEQTDTLINENPELFSKLK